MLPQYPQSLSPVHFSHEMPQNCPFNFSCRPAEKLLTLALCLSSFIHTHTHQTLIAHLLKFYTSSEYKLPILTGDGDVHHKWCNVLMTISLYQVGPSDMSFAVPTHWCPMESLITALKHKCNYLPQSRETEAQRDK